MNSDALTPLTELEGTPIRLRQVIQSDTPYLVRVAGNEAAEAQRVFRIRVVPSCYRVGTGQYVSWGGVTWTLEVPDLATAEAIIRATGAFFEALTEGRVEALQAVIEDWREGQREGRS